jgi:hypothetical protein
LNVQQISITQTTGKKMETKLITTFKEYKELYNIRLENHLKKYVDYDELHFIKSDLVYFTNCYHTTNLKEERVNVYDRDENIINWSYEYNYDSYELLGGSNQEIYNLIVDYNPITNGFDLVLAERLATSFYKITDFLNNKANEITNPTTQPIQNKVKFHGNQTQFLELIKSLIENGNLKGSQNEIITNCSKFFNIEINNPDQTLSKIKGRNNDSETLFLDQLKKTLFDHITTEKTR